MNKQELIEKIEDLETLGLVSEHINKKEVLDLVELLDEPQKPTIPQFVADWIEECKKKGDLSLGGAIQLPRPEIYGWLADWKNQETFARAWLDGYTVEEEKKYKITLLNRNDGDLYLVNQNADLADKYGHFSPVVLLFTKCTNFSKKCYELTKKDVVSYDFGWVFDCPGVEVKEVE